MSRPLLDTMKEVHREKQHVSYREDNALDAGRVWTLHICEKYGLDVDDVSAANSMIAEITIGNVLRWNDETSKLPLKAILELVHASGFTNGLAAGFEHRER